MRGKGINSIVNLVLFVFLLTNFSCVPIKKLEYFKDFKDFGVPRANPKTPRVIMPFDKLSIIVLSTDEQSIQILNFPEEKPGWTGYQVDEQGNLFFPFAGEIHVAGLTNAQATELIKVKISSLVPNPVVIVSHLDSQVTILGEVNNQGVYDITQDNINIYEAIALGGGISEWGDRRKVVLLRAENNKPNFHILDLSSSEIAYGEFFYVLPNDVVFVEPMRAKVYKNPLVGQIWTSLVSVAITIIIYSQWWSR